MDRRTVDEDLDDLTLDDADLETDGDDQDIDAETTAGGLMAPPPKRTANRKPPVRKTTSGPSGNGKSNGRLGSIGSSGAKPTTDDSTADDTITKDSAVGDLNDPPEKATPAGSAAGSAAKGGGEDTTEVIPANLAKLGKPEPDEPEASGAASANKAAAAETAATEMAATETKASEKTAPAMPADDIWSPRSAPTRSGTGTASSWTPVEASARPRGNAFEVNDAFSAPPMPSESGSPAAARSFGASSSTSTPTPPAQAFPRSGSTVKPGARATSAKAAPKATATVRRQSAGRQAHLTVARVEPWSVMKFSFAVSVISFVVLFVAVAVLFAVLSLLGVFDSLQHLVTSVTSSQSSGGYNVRKWFSASRVLGFTALLGVINIVLITAMSTIGAVVYNLTSRLIGGVEVTLKETD